MTSSLVGSEMCIRDRLLSAFRKARRRPPLHRSGREPVCRSRLKNSITSVVKPGDRSRQTSLGMPSHPSARRRGRAANT
eukprot:2566847-Prorocentrum_lima.AAC.1